MLNYFIAPSSILARSSDAEKKHWLILGVVSFFVLMIFSVPWYPSIPKFSLDSSWMLVMQYAFENNLLFGKDLLWHYGPLGFLFGGNYYPGNYLVMLLLYIMLSLVFFIGLWRVITEKAHTEMALVIPVIFIAISYDAFFIAFGQLLFCYYFFVSKSLKNIILWLLWLALIIVALVKITYLILAVMILLLMDIDRIFARSLPFWMVLSIAAWYALWEILGQDSAYFITWIKGALEITRGFKAMGLYRSWHYAVAFLTCYAVFTALIASVLFQRIKWRALIPLAGIAGMGIMCLKLGFIHSNDHHFIEAILIFIFLAFLTKDLVWSAAGKTGQRIFFATYVIILCLFSWQVMQGKDPSFQNVTLFSESSNDETAISYSELLKTLTMKDGGLFTYNKKYYAIQERIRAKIPLPKLNGDVDIYSYHQAFVFANNYDYNPRPVFQSYHAYTAFLAKANRDYIINGKSAQNILFAITPFDNRMAAFDDGLSWPALRTHYRLAGEDEFYLHLFKRKIPQTSNKILLSQDNYNINDVIYVPDIKDNSTIWVEIKLEPTIFGRLTALFFHEIMWDISVKYNSGTENYNFIREIGESGFMISPVISDTYEFKQWFNGLNNPQKEAEFFQIQPRHSADWLSELLFLQQISVKFYELNITTVNSEK